MAIGRIREITFDDGAVVSGDIYTLADLMNPAIIGDEGIYFDNISGIPTLSPWREGVVVYDPHDGTLVCSSKYDGTWVSWGQEITTPVVNKLGFTVANGKAVYIYGAQGNRPTIALASASNHDAAQSTIGLCTIKNGILNNQEGLITEYGLVRDLDTHLYNEGDKVWLSTNNGDITTTKPSNLYDHILIGFVNVSHTTHGEIFVNVRDLTDPVQKMGAYCVDPHGWTTPDDSLCTLSLNYTTREVKLTPNSVKVPYYHKGELKFLESTISFTVPPIAGKHFVCFNCTTKQFAEFAGSLPIAELIDTHIYVAFVLIDDLGNAVIMANERHSTRFLKRDWLYKHKYLSTQYESGLNPTVSNPDASGALDSHARFSVTSGSIADEDIPISIAQKLESGNIYKYYRTNAGVWRRLLGNDSASGVLNTGTGRAAYNPIAGNLSETPNNNFILCHLFAMHNNEFAVIVGNDYYGNPTSARLAARTELSNLIMAGLVAEEYRAVATFIYQTSNSYSNLSKSRIVSVDTGVYFIDWRTSSLNPVAGQSASNHNSLSGIQGGNVNDYYHLPVSKYSEVMAGFVGTGGNAQNTSASMLLPYTTYANLLAMARSAGKVYYATDIKKVLYDNGTELKEAGGGLSPVTITVSGTTPSIVNLETGKHYIVDMSGATGDVSFNAPSAASEVVFRISVVKNYSVDYRAIINRVGSDQFYYKGAVDTSVKIYKSETWVEFCYISTNLFCLDTDDNNIVLPNLPLSLGVELITSAKSISYPYSSCSGSAGYAVTLPNAVGIRGLVYTIKSNMNAGILLTINTTSSQTIDGLTSVILSRFESLQVISNGANWEVI